MRYMMFVAIDPDAEPESEQAHDAAVADGELDVDEWVDRHDASGARLIGERLRLAEDSTQDRGPSHRCGGRLDPRPF